MPGDLGPQCVVTGARVLLLGWYITEEQGLTGREGDAVRATVFRQRKKSVSRGYTGQGSGLAWDWSPAEGPGPGKDLLRG